LPARDLAWRTLWVVACAVLTVPAAIVSSGITDLDSSWRIGIQLAYRQHLQFGQDVLFTYGPLGFLGLDGRFDFFGTWLIAMVAQRIVHVAFFAVLALFLVRVGARPWHWLLAGAAFLLPLAFAHLEYECMVIAVVLLQLALNDENRRIAMAAAVSSGAVLGLLLVVKGTGIAAALGLLVVFGVLAALRGRSTLVVAGVLSLLVALIGLWLAAGQHLDAVIPYFRASVESVSGYAAAMGYLELSTLNYLPGQLWIAAGGMAVLVVPLAASLHRRDWPLFSLIALSLPIDFVLFKESFVRMSDRHMFYLSILLILDILVFVQATLGPPARLARLRVLIPGVSAGLIALSSVSLVAIGAMDGPQIRPPVSTLQARLATYGSAYQLVTNGAARSTQVTQRHEQALASYGMPGSVLNRLRSGSVDVFPQDIALISTYQLPWRPAGVLQSYAAYTPFLDQHDAAGYVAHGPEFVLLNHEGIDDRYTPFDEPAFFRAMLQHYTVTSRAGSLVILERAPAPATGTTDLGRASHRFGDWIAVPRVAGRWTMAEVDRNPSIVGRLYDLAFEGPEAHITLRLDDGTEREYRLIPTSRDGLLVSDFVGGSDDYASLFAGHPTSHHIVAFRVTTADPVAFASTFDTHFYSVASR
jgi:hypothetical protein